MKLIPVILSGGAGTRLWPLSRQNAPKPFLQVQNNGRSLLQNTLIRAAQLPQVEHLLVVTHEDYFLRTQEEYRLLQTPNLNPHYLLEPCARNTAPAVLMSAYYATQQIDPDAILCLLSADHMIKDDLAFTHAIQQAATAAEAGYLIIFGIPPTHPETGYGYIEYEALTPLENTDYPVVSFKEKPDLETAKIYLASKSYLWNAGFFCIKASVLIQQLESCAPSLFQQSHCCWKKSTLTPPITKLDSLSYQEIPSISIDYALLEKIDKSLLRVIKAPFEWHDIGSWKAMSQLTEKDKENNAANREAIWHDAKNNYLHQTNPGKLTAVLGLQEMIVVDTPDALLLAHTKCDQAVKQVVEQLRQTQHPSSLLHRTVYRPWGTYTVLEESTGYKLKRIVVKPGASLSLQMHHHRSEHWVIISGEALIINGEQEIQLKSNESTFIPAGHKHRLTNPGALDLIVIEVQTGSYLGEDDIVRFEDAYGRIISKSNS